MTAPQLTLLTTTRSRISAIPGQDVAVVQFVSDQDLVYWEARADGAGPGQGDLVGQAAEVRDTWAGWDALGWTWEQLDARRLTWDRLNCVLSADTVAVFEVENEELTWGDKTYRINLYGRNTNGEWSANG